MRYAAFIFGLLTVLFLPASEALGLNADLFPSEVNPGDVFIIRISGAGVSPDALMDGNRFYFSECGEDCFITVGAVKLDARHGRHAITLKSGKDKKTLWLTVKRVSFPVVRFTLPPDKVFLSPQDLKRVEEEEKRLSVIWKTITPRLWDGAFVLPLENEILTSFGTKRIINKKKVSIHKGIDMRGKEGTEVRASNTGKIVFMEELFFGGNTIAIDHGMGIYTIYMHLSGFNVKPGDTVLKGDVIGFVGSTGRATGPHLHYGLKVSGITANPVSILGLLP